MVILFITNGLEPGKDGVGDYTRLLAAECIRQNHSCCLMSLNDSYVSQPVESIDFIDGFSIPILRLPNRLSWKKRVELAVNFRARHAVDWISLQFVCYGFNRKGVVWNLARYFEPIIGDNPLHVMFHETWIGAGKPFSIKDRLVGKMQRYYIRKLFSRLKPHLVNASNPFYVAQLQNIGMPAVEAPLFSNITVNFAEDEFHIPEALIQAGVCDERGLHENLWLGLFFGALYAEWKAEPFMGILGSAAGKAGKRICLIGAGRMGGPGNVRWEKLQKNYAEAVDFITVGECTPLQISTLMRVADFGVAATPRHLLGKSSSATAMLDHGLPVIVTRDEFVPEAPSTRPLDPLVHRCDAELESKLQKGLPKRAPRDRKPEVVATFIRALAELKGPLK